MVSVAGPDTHRSPGTHKRTSAHPGAVARNTLNKSPMATSPPTPSTSYEQHAFNASAASPPLLRPAQCPASPAGNPQVFVGVSPLAAHLRGGPRARLGHLAPAALLALLAACAGESSAGESSAEAEGAPPATEPAAEVEPGPQPEAQACIPGAPQQDCDSDPSTGCETDTFTDINHCGACNSPCASACIEGRCADPVDLALHFGRTCALLGTGEATCWGLNYYGQLGNGSGGTLDDDTAPSAGPSAEIPLGAKVSLQPTVVQTSPGMPLRNIRQLALGRDHSCALAGSEGTVYCWGANYNGQLGDGTTSPRAFAEPVLAPEGAGDGRLTGITYLSAGFWHTCAVTSDGRAVCWGRDWSGSLGRGQGTSSAASSVTRPSYVLQPGTGSTHLEGVKATALGATFSCFSLGMGIACTGDAFRGKLGNGTTGTEQSVDRAGPVLSPLSDNQDWALPVLAMTNASSFQCALTSAGMVACWGSGGRGQVGRGDFNASNPVPGFVMNSEGKDILLGVRHLSAADSHVCATTEDDEAWCWGNNQYQTLGSTLGANDLGITRIRSALPVAVRDPATGQRLTAIDRVVPGVEHTCALMRDKRVLCWGRNLYGELGHGTPSFVPALAAEATVHPN